MKKEDILTAEELEAFEWAVKSMRIENELIARGDIEKEEDQERKKLKDEKISTQNL